MMKILYLNILDVRLQQKNNCKKFPLFCQKAYTNYVNTYIILYICVYIKLRIQRSEKNSKL